ncbi:MAG: glycosyltransferase family 4 protein [Bacteroidetes bacterium]|nr:glycosyltransferase family 4 protein [Bacteroidota bacterium]
MLIIIQMMNQQKLRILFISSWFPNKEQALLGNFVEKHLHAVSKYSNCMLLHVAFSNSSENSRYHIEFTEVNQIPYLLVYINRKSLSIPFIGNILKFCFYTIAYLKGYKYLVKKIGKPDLIHANVFYPGSFITLLISKLYSLPYLFTEHWTAYMPDDPHEISFFQKFLIRIAARKAKFITVVSEDLQKAMMNAGIFGNYVIVPNVVDKIFYNPEKNGKNTDKTSFIHISSLDDKQKNISGIINTVHQLSLFRNDFELIIIGDGNADSHIEMAKTLNVYNSFIQFEGTKTTDEIATYLQKSDCLLMFSNFESFSVVIAEALASGLAVIATKAGGLANELSNEYGIFIDANDDEALLKAMNNMIDNHKNYNKKQLTEYALRFSEEKVGLAFHTIYQKITEQNSDK